MNELPRDRAADYRGVRGNTDRITCGNRNVHGNRGRNHTCSAGPGLVRHGRVSETGLLRSEVEISF